MTPGDREFGELIGKVDAIGAQLADMVRTNSAEHEANGRKLERIEARIDSLESTRDKFSAGKAVMTGVAGAACTLLGILIGHF